MKVGIIGKGKMGLDIFNYLLQFDNSLVLICRNPKDIETLTITVEKQINKMLKRGYINDEEYKNKMKSFEITNIFTALKDCDIVIETVYEDKILKQEIFKQVESIVRPDCILASNTSSIPLKSIFEKCNIKSRCLGIHFFFPVKIISIVEVNKTAFTEQKYVNIVKELLSNAEKSVLVLEEPANMILTKMFTILITQIYNIYEENYLRIDEIDKVIKEKLLVFGLFEIIDSTGINIIIECIKNFIDDRYRKIYIPFYYKGIELIQKGYIGGRCNKGIAAYEKENPVALKEIGADELIEYKDNIILRLQSLIINELAFIITQYCVEKEKINQAIKEVLGLAEDPIQMYKRIGEQKIVKCLLDDYKKHQDDVFLPMEFSVFSN